jgi:hypothetical protein
MLPADTVTAGRQGCKMRLCGDSVLSLHRFVQQFTEMARGWKRKRQLLMAVLMAEDLDELWFAKPH